jgi:hypothetical protein
MLLNITHGLNVRFSTLKFSQKQSLSLCVLVSCDGFGGGFFSSDPAYLQTGYDFGLTNLLAMSRELLIFIFLAVVNMLL